MIKKVKGGYKVLSEKTGKNLRRSVQDERRSREAFAAGGIFQAQQGLMSLDFLRAFSTFMDARAGCDRRRAKFGEGALRFRVPRLRFRRRFARELILRDLRCVPVCAAKLFGKRRVLAQRFLLAETVRPVIRKLVFQSAAGRIQMASRIPWVSAPARI